MVNWGDFCRFISGPYEGMTGVYEGGRFGDKETHSRVRLTSTGKGVYVAHSAIRPEERTSEMLDRLMARTGRAA